ncbi:MAG: isoprenyl transferase [Chloroflexota bacterium]|jgi:undecaprenyl diphosphate synthase
MTPPVHVAIIMDGNGRWAKARGLPRIAGHHAGTENLRRIIRSTVEFGVRYLTLYAFSTENWTRPQDEVQGLMQILSDAIERELKELHDQGVQIRHIGDPSRLNPTLWKRIENAIELTKKNDRLTLSVALNYGGRAEIIHAIQAMMLDGHKPEDINEALISQYLYTKDIPDPDLIIRTSGELRVSNFLIWQGAYSEWYVTPTFWPDFDKEEYRRALETYTSRERRFGGLKT